MDRKKGGFTLLEVLIAIALIGIIVGVAIPQYKYAHLRAREAVLKEDLFQMRLLLQQYYNDKWKYPASLQDLVTDGYLQKLPVDPITKSADTWVVVQEELSDDDIVSGVQAGVFDVKSGSDKISSEGTPYNIW